MLAHIRARAAELAEEYAAIIEAQGRTMPAADYLNQRIRADSAFLGLEPMTLTLLIAREWDRLGISRAPASAGPLGE